MNPQPVTGSGGLHPKAGPLPSNLLYRMSVTAKSTVLSRNCARPAPELDDVKLTLRLYLLLVTSRVHCCSSMPANDDPDPTTPGPANAGAAAATMSAAATAAPA